MKKHIKIGLLILMGLAILLISLGMFYNSKKTSNMIYGVSFSPYYTEYLDLDYRQVYTAILDDWQFKYIRLSAQWDKIEKKEGIYDFTDLDWMMDESAKREAKVVLAVGRKTPRWPECHLPDWAKKKEYEDYRQDLLEYIEAVVNRYKNHKALEMWQVENEPFLPFGLCKVMPRQDLREEVGFVKKIDQQHKTMVTDSGELSTWRKTAKQADYFGTTMYRVVWNKWIGYFNYDWLPAVFYRSKLKLTGRDLSTAYIMELQAEPWIPGISVQDTPLEEQFKSMGIKRLKKNIEYSSRTGMPRAYLWGAEWWYWMENKKGDKSFVNYIKTIEKQ
ncbi:MAG: beta-galactosidase [bacterium]